MENKGKWIFWLIKILGCSWIVSSLVFDVGSLFILRLNESYIRVLDFFFRVDECYIIKFNWFLVFFRINSFDVVFVDVNFVLEVVNGKIKEKVLFCKV